MALDMGNLFAEAGLCGDASAMRVKAIAEGRDERCPEPSAADPALCAAGFGFDPVIFAIRRSSSAAISEPSRYLL